MSHRPLRDNKTCLNCGHEVPIRYCTYCGQENIVPEEKFSHLAHHFFEDITHYDSKFFLTLRDLIIKPGFLTKEYIAGRRVSYLNPVRMYVFISFLFFLLLFSFNYHNNVHIKQESASNIGDISQNRKFSPEDSAAIKAAEDQANAADNTLMLSSPRQYDSLQSALPPDKRQGRFLQFFNRKYLAIKSQYGERTGEVLMERFQHNIPKVMFILLPFFAVLLKLFYRKKRWLYVNHVIFSIHNTLLHFRAVDVLHAIGYNF